jgi:hypothetical protein
MVQTLKLRYNNPLVCFTQINSLAITRYQWLILLFLNLVTFTCFLILRIPDLFSTDLVVVELLAILRFFSEQKLQKISGTHVAVY